MGALTPALLLRAYAAGIFPMAESADDPELFWIDPEERGVLPLDGFHLPHRLRRTLRADAFTVDADKDFAAVIRGCAAATADRPKTWINDEIIEVYSALHQQGFAHSLEARQCGVLVGGLYGVKLGRAFFGESMFSRRTDASKVALAWLVARLKVGNFTLLDCQFMTEHLASLGAVTIPRETYVALLSAALGGGVVAAAGSVELVDGVRAAFDARPDFLALDRLLELAGALGTGGPAGYVIAQLLGQTS